MGRAGRGEEAAAWEDALRGPAVAGATRADSTSQGRVGQATAYRSVEWENRATKITRIVERA